MFDHFHLGHQIGQLDHFIAGVAAGYDDVFVEWARFQYRENFFKRQIIIAQHDVEFV